jgi:hypothetical protein
MTVIMRCGGTDAILESIATLDSIALAGVRAHGGDELQPGCSPRDALRNHRKSVNCGVKYHLLLVGTHKYT